MSPRQLARMLQNNHQTRSWRKISREDYHGLVPAGTLAMIAKTNGDYVPAKWRVILGVTRSHKPRPHSLADMSKRELLFAFEHRVEMA
jgi:hypothetical protein